MTTMIQFKNKLSSRNDAVIVSDNGETLEIRVWIGPSSRFRAHTETIRRSQITRIVGPAKGQFAAQLREAA